MFVVFLTTPTIVTLIDSSIDISMYYTSAEEEEKGNEKTKNCEKLFFENPHIESAFSLIESEDNLGYYIKKYPKPHLNLISPPPELNIV
ncbi:hypothetical protein FUA26_03335 [Seonamhaeicola algicola]|uniref:Uncharacterized protein n=1 Tax=Seonamhaeicola algicola TaxID=1719036 RepID=A0A5C7AZS8_9FLAO|nr:hypothetical protein FUA26_03335 [Seonamhaeicola algicola]